MRAIALTLLALAAALALGQEPPTVSLLFDEPTAEAGMTVSGVVLVAIPSGFHAYSNPPMSEDLIPLGITEVAGAELVSAFYPPGEPVLFAGEEVGGYSGTVRIPLQLRLPEAASGTHEVTVTVHYQLCDDTQCYLPGDAVASASVKIVTSAGQPTDQTGPEQGGQPDQGVTHTGEGAPPEVGAAAPPEVSRAPAAPPAEPAGVEGTLAEWLRHAQREGKWWLGLLVFLLGGIALNLTPCVYPVIAPTAGFIAKQSEGVTGGRFAFGLTFLIGAAVVFGAVGTIFGYTGTLFGSLFQHAWFTISLGVLMLLLALAMFDVYQIRLPDRLAGGSRGRAGLLGALLMGMFIGVAAVPCGGPVIALVAAIVLATKNLAFGAYAFTTMGIGLALPVTLLITTGALGVLARPGEWMVTIKHILGLAVIASGIYFLSFTLVKWIGPEAMAWVWGCYLILGAFYLLVFDHTGRTQTGIYALKSVVALAAVYYGATIFHPVVIGAPRAPGVAWEELSMDAFEAKLGKGVPIVIDFTGKWCGMCQEIDHKTFSDPDVAALLARAHTFRADFSDHTDKELSDYFGAKALPVVLLYNGQGKLVRRFEGFFDAEQFLDAASSAGLRPPP
jgi:thiol:disulfide interchange protein DsbD